MSLKEISVLLVADETILRAALREMLAKHPGLRLVGVCDTGAAVRESQALNPQVVILHVPVPGLASQDLIKELHGRSGVVILSRESQEAYVRGCFSSGALAYMLVRGEPADLGTAIRAAAAKRRFIDPLLHEILARTLARDEHSPSDILSAREAQVLTMLAYGYTNHQIADKLSVSSKSVDTYRHRISSKLNLHNRAEIVRYAISMGLMRSIDSDLESTS